MPFTFAHPAIVLPGGYLPKQWVSLTGLVAGSLAPDFEYFFRWQVLSLYSHSLPGIFWFDLPVALALSFVYHLLIKKALLDNLPFYFKKRLLKFKNFNWINYFKKHAIVVILSIIMGVFSHILWDSFTHEQGYFVEEFALLSHKTSINQISIPVYKLLQHGSSMLGIFLIVLAICNLPADKSVKSSYQPTYWIMLASLTILFISIRSLFGLELKQYGNVVITVISAGLLSLSITPLLLDLVVSKNFD